MTEPFFRPRYESPARISRDIRKLMRERVGATPDEAEMAVAEFWRESEERRQRHYSNVRWERARTLNLLVEDARATGQPTEPIEEEHRHIWMELDKERLAEEDAEEFCHWLEDEFELMLDPHDKDKLIPIPRDEPSLDPDFDWEQVLVEMFSNCSAELKEEESTHLSKHPYCSECSRNGSATPATTTARVVRFRHRLRERDRKIRESLCDSCLKVIWASEPGARGS